MKYLTNLLVLLVGLSLLSSCEKEIRNIAPGGGAPTPNPTIPEEVDIIPVDINEKGFEFLDRMQGHWVGQNRVIADDYDFFAFDYRPISPSHIHGIFEGGSMGNLFTSFFVTDFKEKRTIMARNGGVLSGIYRTSYFVLDSVNYANNGDYYRFVDAEGGTNVMWMELRFTADSLYFNAYTSRLGLNFPANRHMTFRGTKEHLELAHTAAATVGFPQNIPAWDFSEGFNPDHLNASPGAKSATYLAQQEQNDVFELAVASGDPFRIDQHPYLGYLQVDIVQNEQIRDKDLSLFLSLEPLTDQDGYFPNSLEPFQTIVLFPNFIGNTEQFLITYLHPGEYYVTIIADANGDGDLGGGDITHPSQKITIDPEGQHQITIDNINVVN
jgi:hypothetical protein